MCGNTSYKVYISRSKRCVGVVTWNVLNEHAQTHGWPNF